MVFCTNSTASSRLLQVNQLVSETMLFVFVDFMAFIKMCNESSIMHLSHISLWSWRSRAGMSCFSHIAVLPSKVVVFILVRCALRFWGSSSVYICKTLEASGVQTGVLVTFCGWQHFNVRFVLVVCCGKRLVVGSMRGGNIFCAHWLALSTGTGHVDYSMYTCRTCWWQHCVQYCCIVHSD